VGLLRYVLASVVVIFHLSGINMFAGRLAVMGFYVVSGYLIARVIDARYGCSPAGLTRFAVNRFLRLYPLYVVLFVVAVALFVTVGTPPIHPADPSKVLRLTTGWDWVGLSLLPSYERLGGIPLLLASSSMIPQSWSIEIELAFYLTAVAAAAIGLRRTTPALVTVGAIWFLYRFATVGDFRQYDNTLYKDVLSTAVFFWAGAALHVYGHRLRVSERVYWPALLGLVFLVHGVLGNRFLVEYVTTSQPGWNWVMLGAHVLMLVNTALVIQATRQRRESRVLRRLGDLSYGIYLNHFIVAVVMLAVANWVGYPVFGRYNGGEVNIGLLGLAVASAFAWVTYWLVEHPLERWRGALRGGGVEAAGTPLPAA
jgi:peptidoglycan/LPS O-acetylase OafA/YrhL